MGRVFGFWRRLNWLGKAAVLLLPVVTLSRMVNWPPQLHGHEPFVAHYLLATFLLMIDVPLAWAAWRALKGRGDYRALAAMAFVFTATTFLFLRITADRDRPRFDQPTAALMVYTLLFVAFGVGRKPAA
jgi:hypothetical protein